jgi:hypothetical protein
VEFIPHPHHQGLPLHCQDLDRLARRESLARDPAALGAQAIDARRDLGFVGRLYEIEEDSLEFLARAFERQARIEGTWELTGHGIATRHTHRDPVGDPRSAVDHRDVEQTPGDWCYEPGRAWKCRRKIDNQACGLSPLTGD